jgi:SAM-dependent methyltransferase
MLKYGMDLSSLRTLQTPEGQAALQAAASLEPRGIDYLPNFQLLCRTYPEDLARPALEIAILRREAAVKFPFADRLYLTRDALEQASSWQVAEYRARRYREYSLLLDLGCSVGGDTLALADAAPTIGIDIDPLRLAMAQLNIEALGKANRSDFLQADLNQPLPFIESVLGEAGHGQTGIFFDPARRQSGRRLRSVRAYQPPLHVVMTWLPDVPSIGVKISPGVKLAELQEYQSEVEFISLKGDLKEAVLWFGPLRTANRRATLLPGEHTLATGQLAAEGEPDLPVAEPRAWLYEPDPAVLRAGLVAALGARLDAAQLDPDIAYLTAGNYRSTPFARAWAVEDWFPFGLKKLRSYLRERNIGRVTVKKRGSPLVPEALIQDLRLRGKDERVLFLTHLRGRPIVIVAQPIQACD